MDAIRLIGIIPVRGRIAFALAMAEYAIQLSPNHQNLKLLRHALEASWKWEEGGEVSVDDLDELLEGGDGSLMDCASLAIAQNGKEDPLLQVCAIVVAYVTREASLQIGKQLSETVELATEEALEQALEVYLPLIVGYQSTFLERIAKYLSAHYRTDHPSELGPVVDREVILRVGCEAA